MVDNRTKACCAFGHREVYENITDQLDKAVLEAATQGCVKFYTGAMGQFDSLYASAVRKAKRNYPNIKLICVKVNNAVQRAREVVNAEIIYN